MTNIHPWVFGLAAKPEHLQEVRTLTTFEKVYPVHRYGTEVDPSEHKCIHCGAKTDLYCESCEQPTCDNCYGTEKFGGPYGDGPSGLNYCKSCMDHHYDRTYCDYD